MKGAAGQHRIMRRDGQLIKEATLVEVKPLLLVYKKDGSLHDLETRKLRWLEKEDDEKWTVDSVTGMLVPYIKNDVVMRPSTALEKSRDSITTKENANGISPEKPVVTRITKRPTNSEELDEIRRSATPVVFESRVDSNSLAKYSSAQFFELGREDAHQHFHAPLSTVLGVASLPFIWTFMIPLGTVVQAAIPANPERWGVSPYLLNKPEYVQGFKRGSVEKKFKNAGLGFGITGGVILAYVIASLYGAR